MGSVQPFFASHQNSEAKTAKENDEITKGSLHQSTGIQHNPLLVIEAGQNLEPKNSEDITQARESVSRQTV